MKSLFIGRACLVFRWAGWVGWTRPYRWAISYSPLRWSPPYWPSIHAGPLVVITGPGRDGDAFRLGPLDILWRDGVWRRPSEWAFGRQACDAGCLVLDVGCVCVSLISRAHDGTGTGTLA